MIDCQLCKVRHKIKKISQNSTDLLEADRKKIQRKKNIVLQHKIIDKDTKKQFQHLVDDLKEGHGKQLKRTSFGMALLDKKKEPQIYSQLYCALRRE
jgi:hypothetical protein